MSPAEYTESVRIALEEKERRIHTLEIVIERLLNQREDTAWDQDVRVAYATLARAAVTQPAGAPPIGSLPEMAMNVADQIQKGREERAKFGTLGLSSPLPGERKP